MKAFCPRIIIALAIFVLTSSCAESKELTRSRALALIRDSKEVKEPGVFMIRNGDPVTVEAKAADEPEQDAQARAIEAYLNDQPVMAVFRHLGLIEVSVEVTEKPKVVKAPEIVINRPDGTKARSPVGSDHLKPWKFTIRTSLTDKGKEAAKGGENSIPLYTKEVLEVTGITNSTGQAAQAQAEFKWRIVPTVVGEAFDRTSQTYKNLPPKLQQLLRKPQGLMQKTPLASTSEIDSSIKKGVAFFQRYDDGWRLIGIQ